MVNDAYLTLLHECKWSVKILSGSQTEDLCILRDTSVESAAIFLYESLPSDVNINKFVYTMHGKGNRAVYNYLRISHGY